MLAHQSQTRSHQPSRLAADAGCLDQPLGESRVAGILDVEPTALRAVRAVRRVRDTDRRGDHRRVRAPQRRQRRAQHETEQVAVAAEPVPEASGQTRERGAVAQQQERRSQRARAEHQPVARDRVLLERGDGGLDVRLVHDVADVVAAACQWRDRAHLVQGADVRPGVLRRRQVRVVERVLAAVVAAEIALPAQQAAHARASVQVPVVRERDGRAGRGSGAADRERHRERRLLRGVAEPYAGVLEQLRLAGYLVAGLALGESLRVQRALGPVVVRVEVGAGDRPGLVPVAGRCVAHEPLLVLAQQHVGVDQRAAAEAAGDHRLEVAERPDVEQTVQALAGVPEVAGHVGRRPGEGAGRVRTAALHHDDAAAALGEPPGGDRTPEARPDDEDVDVLPRAVHGQVARQVLGSSAATSGVGARCMSPPPWPRCCAG